MRERKDIMLAHPMTVGKLHGYSKCFLQPKLNGERCHVEWFNGEPLLFSSTGLEFPFLEHIKKELLNHPGRNWDGELYTHMMPREEVASIANRKKNRHPDQDKLEYHIFDFIDFQKVQAERVVELGKEGFKSCLELVPTHIITIPEVTSYTNWYIAQGYEGIILRHPMGLYETKRSNAMLKHKPTEVDYYVILEVLEATSEAGEPKGMVGAFKVLSKSTKDTFQVSAGKILHKDRVDIWNNKAEYKFKLLKVKHEKIRTDARGIPVSCVAISVVDKEEENENEI